MSNTTDVLSFDEYWNDQKKNGFIPTFSDVASNAFEAGQQSKQAEVDKIVWVITEAYKSGGNSSVETIYDKIQEILK